MRITINKEQATELKKLIKSRSPIKLKSIVEEIELQENKEVSSKLISGASKAREKRSKDTNKKIENAINTLEFENKKITVYSVSKLAGVSFNTCNKQNIKEMINNREEVRIKRNK
jgi:adenylate kinase family enzyme